MCQGLLYEFWLNYMPQRDIYSLMLITALFTITKIQKQLRRPLTEKWTKK